MSFQERTRPPTQCFGEIQSYYVVVRGLIPGIYTTTADVLDNIIGIDGAYVQNFTSRESAIAAWKSILDNHLAVSLDPTDPGSLLNSDLGPAFSEWKKLSNSLLEDKIQSPVASNASSTDLTHPPVNNVTIVSDGSDDGAEWHTTGLGSSDTGSDDAVEWDEISQSKRRWVVSSGRSPGIYDSWPKAHAEIHGGIDPQLSYQQFKFPFAAECAWDRINEEGLVDTAFGDSPEYPSLEDLEMCTACGDGSQM